MFDSSSKMNPGIFSRRHIDYGHFDQCLSLSKSTYVLINVHWPTPTHKESLSIINTEIERQDMNNSTEWSTEFFLDSGLLMHGLSPVVALCVPSECSQRDIQFAISHDAITRILRPMKLSVLSTVSREKSDDGNDDEDFRSLLRIICRSILLGLVFITLTGSLLPSEAPILKHFDAIANIKKLFVVSSNSDPLNIIHGFKSLYLFSCMFAHFGTPLNKALMVFIFEIFRFVNGHPAIEGFSKIGFAVVSFNFVIGAALSVNSWMPIIYSKKGRLSLKAFILHRLLRTMPLAVASIAFILSFPIVPQEVGPMVKYIQQNMTGNCLQNAWKELLFVSNYDFVLEACNPISWFSSADFQMYLLNFVTLLFLYKKPNIGVFMIISQFFLGIIFHYFAIVNNNASPVIVMFLGKDYTRLFHTFTTIWSQTHNNLTAYAVGMMLGVGFSSKIRIENEKLIKRLWILCCFMFFTSLAVPIYSYDEIDFKFSRNWEIALGTLFKPFASIGFAGLMFLAWHDREESRLFRFLSWTGWTPISRLSFSIFITHPFVISFVWASSHNPFIITFVEVTMKFLFLVVGSFLFGLIAFVIVEAPFFNIVKDVMGRNKGDQKKSTETHKASDEGETKVKAA
jgi:peptidoglycan/LPS O-acetylase OafA/YrhL